MTNPFQQANYEKITILEGIASFKIQTGRFKVFTSDNSFTLPSSKGSPLILATAAADDNIPLGLVESMAPIMELSVSNSAVMPRDSLTIRVILSNKNAILGKIAD